MHAKFLCTKCIDFHPVYVVASFWVEKGALNSQYLIHCLNLGNYSESFFLSNDFFTRCRSSNRKEPFKKAPVSLKEFWEIDDLQLQKKVHRECSHMEHFQLTLVFSLEEGGKVFHLNERGLVSPLLHFETFLCTQASFVESFLLLDSKQNYRGN